MLSIWWPTSKPLAIQGVPACMTGNLATIHGSRPSLGMKALWPVPSEVRQTSRSYLIVQGVGPHSFYRHKLAAWALSAQQHGDA